MSALAACLAHAHPSVTVVRASTCLLLLAAGVVGCASRRQPAPWIGTWNMTAVESRDSAAGPWRKPFGDAPFGYVTYNADGTHTMNFTRTPTPPMFAAGTDRGASDAELRQAFEGYFSWFGRYTVDPARGIIAHRIEGSLWPSWRNTVQERPFLIRGDTLFLGDLVRSRRVLVRVR